MQGEYGFIPYIVSSCVESGSSPIAEVMSQNMTIEPFNRMPNMVKPSWTITQVKSDTCFVCLTNFPSIQMMPDANPDVWRKTYPMMMDLLLMLKENGCQQINFLTAMNTSRAEQQSDLLVYDMYNKIRPEKDLILALPSWFLPHAWDSMGGKSCVIVAVQDEGQYIDSQAYELMEEYIIAVGLPYDKVHKDRLTQILLSMRDKIEGIEGSFQLFDEEGGDWA